MPTKNKKFIYLKFKPTGPVNETTKFENTNTKIKSKFWGENNLGEHSPYAKQYKYPENTK